MVYYFTSSNVIMLKNIIKDYESCSGSPTKYMKIFIESYDDPGDNSKLCWIVETFLGIAKNYQFLKEVIAHFPSGLTQDDTDYLVIILHAIMFQISSSNMSSLYKCLFNLNKSLLNALANSLKTGDFILEISKIAQTIYDTNHVAKKIVEPLLAWQPFMDKMAIKYSNFLQNMDSNKVKKPTIPVEPNVLKRASKLKNKANVCIPVTPPNSLLYKPKRMVTKSTIDEQLKQAHANNKQKAMKLLNDVKANTCHYSQTQNNQVFSKEVNVQNEANQSRTETFQKAPKYTKTSSIPVKETAAMLKRYNERIKITEQEEIQWLQDLVNDCRNTSKINELEEYDREEREKERLIDIEKKHLLGQISFEDAVLAKKRVQEENKRKREEVIKQKELWSKEIEKWNTEQTENNRKIFEKLSMIELNVIEAKEKAKNKKKEEATKIKEESKSLLLKAYIDKQNELEYKIQMIKEMKVLTLIAKRAKIPKIVDLTETSGFGLLCEMSIAELQERLSSMKITLKEELENKSKLIKEKNIAAKKELDETRKKISNFLDERKNLRKKYINSTKSVSVLSQELNDLKNILEEKRKRRLELTSQTTT